MYEEIFKIFSIITLQYYVNIYYMKLKVNCYVLI